MSIFGLKKYVLGISGGPDSMALLYFYRPFIKVACIVNYNKREDSSKDVELVKKTCEKYKIKLEILNVDKEFYNENKIDNFQTWARDIRYNFFYEIAKKYKLKKLLLAHHLDDFIETAYMQEQKKSKSLFYGIMKKSQWLDLKIYRPFINLLRKKTIIRTCHDFKIQYNIDPTNETDIYERNRVRKIITSWSEERFYNYYYSIKKYNKKHDKQRKRNIKLFNKFINKFNYSYDFYNKLSNDEKYYLIYNYLSKFNIPNPSNNKITNLINFLDSNSKKLYRVKNDLFFKIRKNRIILEEKESNEEN